MQDFGRDGVGVSFAEEAIISDATVDNFTKAVEQNKPGSQQLNDMQKAYFFDLLSDLFNFYSIDQAYKRLLRLIDEDLYKLFPKQLAEYKALEPRIKEKIVEVSQRFRNQYTRLIHESEDYATNQELQERIRSGARYFHKELARFGLCIIRLICLLIIKS